MSWGSESAQARYPRVSDYPQQFSVIRRKKGLYQCGRLDNQGRAGTIDFFHSEKRNHEDIKRILKRVKIYLYHLFLLFRQ